MIKQYGEYKVPFLFATNGRDYIKQYEEMSGIWFRDVRQPFDSSKALAGWPSPQGLEQDLERDITEADKKQMKAITGTMGKAILGMGSVFLGMGMLVAEPKKGMALIAVGRSGWKKAFGKNLKVNGGNGRYSFVGFGSHSVNTIKNSALLRAKQEHAALVAQGIKTDYPSLAEKLMSGEASAITIGELGGELGPLFMTKNSPYSHVATAAMIEK